MVIPNEEGKCCDAVVSHIERVTGTKRTSVIDPEFTREGPPVDLRVSLGNQEYALEHTRLLPFGNRIELAKPYHDIQTWVGRWFPGPLPGTAYYELHIPLDARRPGRGKLGKRRLKGLRDWIDASVDVLQSRAPGRPSPPAHIYVLDKVSGRPVGWDCEFTLARSNDGVVYPREAGSLGVFIGSPDDPETSFIDNLRGALGAKSLQLSQCKEGDQGVRTVLILEAIDLPFGYDLQISERLPGLLKECPAPPDDIFLVHRFPFLWSVWVVKRDEINWPDERLPMPCKGYQDPPAPLAHGLPTKFVEHLTAAETRRSDLVDWRPHFFVENELEDLKRA